MEEIELNEYIRTIDGEIHKVIEIKENRYITNFDDYFYYRYDNNMGGFKSDIVKHSKKLIDLVEVGDILKIKISEEWVEKQDTIKFVVVGQTYTITEIKECLENGLFKIIQILTKEQMETNCYKVGGEK